MADLTVVMVNYNTRALTLQALKTLFANAGPIAMDVVLWDNASVDGSADAIACAFPQVQLIRSDENIGFAAANNRAAEGITTEWLLLLNPDTETHANAIANLLAFGRAHPQAGIVGGRTVFPDGSLNPASCWNRITPWSLLCSALGLSRAFPSSSLFNTEGLGGWRRDTVRHVDIVVGCFLLLRTDLWRALGGFDPRYFMYGEEADLCLRARRLGCRPMITPDAEIMHLAGASTPGRIDRLIPVMRAKATLVRDHWSRWAAPFGIALMALWGLTRRLASAVSGPADARVFWREVWARRREWLRGY